MTRVRNAYYCREHLHEQGDTIVVNGQERAV
jgi:hypothetical protein